MSYSAFMYTLQKLSTDAFKAQYTQGATSVASLMLGMAIPAITTSIATGLPVAIWEMESPPTMTVEAVSSILIMCFVVAIQMYTFIAAYSLLPFLGGCGHHGKLFGDASMKFAMMYPESIPVIKYRKDQSSLISLLKDLYEEIYTGVSKAAEELPESVSVITYGILSLLPLPQFVRTIINNMSPQVTKELFTALISIIVGKKAEKTALIMKAIEGSEKCASDKPKGWKWCYVGGFTSTIEAFVGPLSLPTTVAFGYNPFLSWWTDKKIIKKYRSAVAKLMFGLYNIWFSSIIRGMGIPSKSQGFRYIFRLFLGSTLPSIFTLVSLAYYHIYCFSVYPMDKYTG